MANGEAEASCSRCVDSRCREFPSLVGPNNFPALVKRLSGNPWSFRLRSFCIFSCRFSSPALSRLPFKNLVLPVFSLYFYAWGEGLYVLLMIASGLGNFAIARWIAANSGSRARAILALGVAAQPLQGLLIFPSLGF